MSKILFVQGMNTRRVPEDRFRERYYHALRDLLARVAEQTQEPLPLPEPDDVKLLSWVDLVPTEIPPPSKGWIDDFEEQFNAYLRILVLDMDAKAEYDLSKPAPSYIGRKLRPSITQAAMYMGGLPAARVLYPAAEATLRGQVLARCNELITCETRIVIGHSLGTVIAYEALCNLPHSVRLLLTVGSPLGIPKFIYERLEERRWPNVERWCNVSCTRDVFFVPVPVLAPLFGDVVDLSVTHGRAWSVDETHKLPRYFQHLQVGHEIADAWRKALAEG